MTGGLGVFLCFVLLSLYGVYSVGFVYIGGGVGWGGDVNVLTTTSSILRCQDRCSLEVATCNYVETTLGWGGVGWGCQRPDDYVDDSTLST